MVFWVIISGVLFLTMAGFICILFGTRGKSNIDSFSVLVLFVVLFTVHHCPRNVCLKTAASNYDNIMDTFSPNRQHVLIVNPQRKCLRVKCINYRYMSSATFASVPSRYCL